MKMDESEKALIRLETEFEQFRKWKEKMETKMDCEMVSRKEFDPVKNIVFGAVGVMLVTILGAVLALLFHSAK